MAAITINRQYVSVDGACVAFVSRDPQTGTYHVRAWADMTVVWGTATRVEAVGPRGGEVVQWIARDASGCRVGTSARYKTRNAAVAAIVEATWCADNEAAVVEAVETVTESTGDVHPVAGDPIKWLVVRPSGRESIVMARTAVEALEASGDSWVGHGYVASDYDDSATAVEFWTAGTYACDRVAETAVRVSVWTDELDTEHRAAMGATGTDTPTDDVPMPDTCGTCDGSGNECVCDSVESLADMLDGTGTAHCADGVEAVTEPSSAPCAPAPCGVCDGAECVECVEASGRPLGSVAREALDSLSGETDVHYTPTESGTGDVSAVVWAEGNGGNRNAYRVGVYMATDGRTVLNGMDGGGDYAAIFTDDATEAVTFVRDHLELTVPECVVCGGVIDYCPGHGADNYAEWAWSLHDADCHNACRASCHTEGARGVVITSREYDPETDVYDGDVSYQDTVSEWHPDASILDVVDLMESERLTTEPDAHGPEVWTEGAARGERVNIRTGVVTETEAYPFGYTDAELALAAALATGTSWECGGVTVTGMGHRIDPEYATDVVVDPGGPNAWFDPADYDDDATVLFLDNGDILPTGDIMRLGDTFTTANPVMDGTNVHRYLDGGSSDSAWSGHGVIVDPSTNEWSVVRLTW